MVVQGWPACAKLYSPFPLLVTSVIIYVYFYQTFQQMCAPIVPFLPDVDPFSKISRVFNFLKVSNVW